MSDTSAVYPGTFDPMTNGHLDVIMRASKLFSKLTVAVAKNDRKQPFLPLAVRLACIEEALVSFPSVDVVGFDGLLVDWMKNNAVNYIIRGLRAFSDFEYEFHLAGMNRTLSPEVDTLFLMPSSDCLFISSSFVRDIWGHGGDIARFVPQSVLARLPSVLG